MKTIKRFIKIPLEEMFLLLAIVIFGVLFVRNNWIKIENEQSENVLQIAKSIETMLPIEEIKALEAKPEDINKPQHRVIKNTLKTIIHVNPKARFMYVYNQQHGKLYFYADSEPENSKDCSPPGQEYTEADVAYYQPFKDGKEFITGSVTDRWGTWKTVLIPIKDESTGKVFAVFGMDFNAKNWDNLLLIEVIKSSMITLLLLLVIFFLFKLRTKNKLLKFEISERKEAEKALQVSETQKAAILMAIPDLLFVFNQNGDYIDIYSEDDSKLLYSRQALVGKNISDLFPSDIAIEAIEAFRKSIQNNELVQFSYSINNNGKTEFYESRIVPATDNKILAIVRDITERKQAEEALKNSLSLTEATLGSIQNGILVVYQEKVIKINSKFAELWHIPADMLATSDDKALLDFMTGRLTDPDEFIAKVNELYEKPDAESFDVIYFKDGRIFERVSKPMLVEGEPRGRVWSFLDITDRMMAEEELEESRVKYRGLCEAAFEAIFITENGLCIEQNQTAEMMFGYTSEEAIGRYGTDWIVPEEREMVMKNILEGYEDSYDSIALKKDGTTFPCCLRGKMMHYKGKNVRVTSLSDITQRKFAEEELKKKSKELKQFNSFFVGRELKMIELKKEINELLKKAGFEKKYDV